MQIISSKKDLRDTLKAVRMGGKTVGFVPTMGYLHEGHLSLMRKARQENDIVVVSIFVNPTQFGPNEDFESYPRNAQRDTDLMVSESVDIAFLPDAEAIYPEGYATYVEVQDPMTQVLCGKSRPTHFRGVTTIVAKLFNLVTPDRAYFGQKDAQQVAIIRKMVLDLDSDLEVVVCPIVRETDGLAMSSRNAYLTPQQRTAAPILNKALMEAKDMIADGERSAAVIRKFIISKISKADGAEIDYISIVDARSLMKLDNLNDEILIAVAVKFGQTRLIDNVVITV